MVVVTTYSQLRDTTNNNGVYLEKIWNVVVLDEGHKIKNKSTQAFKKIADIVTGHRLVLTGK